MQYIMMPLDAHYDSGFGAIAVSFRDAALALKRAVPKPAFFDHLRQSYLLRHATELFLKSEIVILHRKLKLPYGTEPYNGAPMVGVQGEWKSIHRVHSIGILYEHWKSLINPRLLNATEEPFDFLGHRFAVSTRMRHSCFWSPNHHISSVCIEECK